MSKTQKLTDSNLKRFKLQINAPQTSNGNQNKSQLQINNKVDICFIKSRLLQTIFLGLFLGGFYWQIGGKDYTNSQVWYSIAGSLFFLSIVSVMMQLIPVSVIFPMQRDIFFKQQNSKLYGVLEYFLSRSLIQIPYLLVFPLVLSLIVYWMIGLSSTFQQFFIFYLTSFATGFAGNSLGIFLGSIIKDTKSLSTVTPMVTLPLLLFSGYLKNRQDLPSWIGWIQYCSPVKYSFIALLDNETKRISSNINQLNFQISQSLSIYLLFALGVFLQILSWIALKIMKNRQI